ncbi:hypothetical protein E2C01_031979 [Portunus trituberculatus]|uniref:Uncharacterized protein n=1 Tax=Portunus trituberculatus TaxID=210409 RepID=A0A5B7EW83_PORTR|nr:hypothetical protein [Portunus trituberculatus]
MTTRNVFRIEGSRNSHNSSWVSSERDEKLEEEEEEEEEEEDQKEEELKEDEKKDVFQGCVAFPYTSLEGSSGILMKSSRDKITDGKGELILLDLDAFKDF